MSLNGTSEVIKNLKKKGAHRVALQFPEGLKRQSAAVASDLKDAGFEVIVSGDPCYGACDLALDTLTHADVLVHFGHSPVDEQPKVIFEPYPLDFDVAVLENALPFLKGDTAGLVTTVQHVHLIPAMELFLQAKGISVRVADGCRGDPFCRYRALSPHRYCACYPCTGDRTGSPDRICTGSER
jgi:2-(3-amino-3-carboxypropyl)histidine synthase